MAKKKIYYIPTIEITLLSTPLMQEGLAGGSGTDHGEPGLGGGGHAPRRTPAF